MNPSMAFQIFMDWDLCRQQVELILRSLNTASKLQTTLSNRIGATRSQTVISGKLVASLRPKCNKESDNWTHYEQRFQFVVATLRPCRNSD